MYLFVKRAALVLLLLTIGAPVAGAHCDTMDGPTVADGIKALEEGEIGPALKWIPESSETELQAVLDHVVEVRKTSGEARELADTYFLETLVRLHRAAEGAPYTGLKPAGTPVSHFVQATDVAIETGSVEKVVAHLTSTIADEIQERFDRLQAAKKTKDQSAEAGREYVAAYVDFVHYVEALAEEEATRSTR